MSSGGFLTVHVDTTLAVAQLQALKDFMDARAPWEQQLALSILRALNEIREMATLARRDLGLSLSTGPSIEVNVTIVDPAR